MKKWLISESKRFIKHTEAQDLIEFSLLVVFIALIVIAALPELGKTISNIFVNAATTLQSSGS